ncbi:Peptidase S8/S53 domain-containing protein [Madurella fahalii]|uniref:Peptidase S8/S53 domain-containing protein n=1 Tax=Madurella fahalii TaxID=1157608 RepID=A0ABQ0GL77_9PEZI
MSLSRSLAVGLLCALPLFNTALAASIPPRDDVVPPRFAIAVKLNSTAASLTARALTGTDVVADLIRKAHPGSRNGKRDVDFSVLPLINSVSPEKIAEMVQRATELDPTYVPTDFGAWYQVQFNEPMGDAPAPEIVQLLNTLGAYDEVISCQRLGGAQLPAVQPSNDPRFPEQGYTGANVGINAQYAWGFPGGDGAGTNVIDVERGWKLDHEDLQAAGITLKAGKNVNDRYGGNYPHGTAVLGIMLMVDNAIGGVGIAPAAQGHVVGVTRDVNGAPQENNAEAIIDAASHLSFGDVMLLEIQLGDANNNLMPAEIYDAEYEAIRLATAMGITVVEAGCNGGVNLDLPIVREGESTPRAFLNRNSPDFRDSGAIMVGAGSAALPRTRLSFSNYGSRIDVHSWGEGILTSTAESVNFQWVDGYGNFSGTSGAAPIIAGAALSIQGMVNANRGSKLSAAEMRNLIKIGGTPTSNPSSDMIGVQPDLRALIDGGYLQ